MIGVHPRATPGFDPHLDLPAPPLPPPPGGIDIYLWHPQNEPYELKKLRRSLIPPLKDYNWTMVIYLLELWRANEDRSFNVTITWLTTGIVPPNLRAYDPNTGEVVLDLSRPGSKNMTITIPRGSYEYKLTLIVKPTHPVESPYPWWAPWIALMAILVVTLMLCWRGFVGGGARKFFILHSNVNTLQEP